MGGKPAVTGSGTPVSYDELLGRIGAAATLLEGMEGRVLVIGENCTAWIYGFYAALSRGLVAVPVDAHASAEDIRYIVADCSPSAVICSDACRPAVDAALAAIASPPRVIGFAEIESLAPAAPAAFAADPEATAVLIYTSGTTGSPKGVMLSYRNLTTNMAAVTGGDATVYIPEDRVMMLLPIHHIFPLLGTLMVSLYVGATIVICPSMSGETIIKTLKEHQVSIIIGVPRLYSMIRSGIRAKIGASPVLLALFRLAERLGSRGFSRLLFGSVHRRFGGAIRHMVSGGAALDAEVARDFITLGFDLLEGYGMTEAAPMITFTRPGCLVPGSAGQALAGVELAIKDGEIVARGPNVMQGYWNRPVETADILRDGWLHTGDLGEIDAAGYLRITGRRKEIIILSNGKNVNPSELEAGIEALSPAVKEAAVYAEGDRLRAILVLDAGQLPAEAQSGTAREAWTREHVLKAWNRSAPGWKSLAGAVVSDAELPRTRLGKLQRFRLAALAEACAVPAEAAAPEAAGGALGEEYRIIRDYLEREKKLSVRPGDHPFLDVGLDSLDAVGFQVFLENSFGVKLETERLAAFDSVAELAAHVAAAGHNRHGHEGFDWSQLLKQGVAQAQALAKRLPSPWFTKTLIHGLSRSFFRFWFRYRARGLKNIPDGPCIIAPNHQSFMDGLLVASLLKFRHLRHTFFYAKAKHVPAGFLRRFAIGNDVIVMDIEHNLKESIMKVAQVLHAKRKLVIFPEGTRTKDGTLGDFKRLFAILSRELGVPVVPVSIKGAFEALPRGHHFPRFFRKVRVEVLPPIFPDDLDYDSLVAKVREAIAASLGSRLSATRA
jgi:long-chain acyl-CoA synthetase